MVIRSLRSCHWSLGRCAPVTGHQVAALLSLVTRSLRSRHWVAALPSLGRCAPVTGHQLFKKSND